MLLVFIIFLLIGSFLNVCIYRIPKGQSISYPPSHCPKCDNSLKVIDLIPILSYLILKGRCKYCKERISRQYPIVELLTAIILTLIYIKFNLSIFFIKYSLLSLLLIVISFIDYYHKIIPDKLIVLGLLIGISLHILYPNLDELINSAIGLSIGGGIFLMIAVLTNGAMGGGDIKLMGMLGFMLGWKWILLITLLSFIIGAIISVALMILGLKSRKDYIPFGPFIAIATFITILYGNNIINFYLNTIINL